MALHFPTALTEDKVLNLGEHLAAEEHNISLRRWWNPKRAKRRVNICQLAKSSGDKLNVVFAACCAAPLCFLCA